MNEDERQNLLGDLGAVAWHRQQVAAAYDKQDVWLAMEHLLAAVRLLDHAVTRLVPPRLTETSK